MIATLLFAATAIAVIWLTGVARLSRRLKNIKRESLVGEWALVESLLTAGSSAAPPVFIVAVRGEHRTATCQTPLHSGQPARVVEAVARGQRGDHVLQIEPWPS